MDDDSVVTAYEALCADNTNADLCTVLKQINDNAASMGAGVDTFYLLFAGTIVFLMQAGFAMLCAGSIRQKNVKNIILKNLLDACGGAIGFWAFGYAFAYGGADSSTPDTDFIGTKNFFMNGMMGSGEWIFWFFQWAFAAAAATIVAGTVAERCKMSAYLCYSFFLTAFVYPVVARSIWSGNGFLTAFNPDPFQGTGMIDFAGSGVVHMTGGATALIAAIILGPRTGRFYDADGNALEEPADFAGHSSALSVLGTFILWVGWYGFNPGSSLMIANAGSADVAALCAVTTTMAAASGGISSMATDTILGLLTTGETEYDVTCAMNGVLAGLVAITAGCSVVDPWAAVVIGIIAGWVYLAFSKFLLMMKIDDAVDAVPVHFANGMWGCIAVGLFARPECVSGAYSITAKEGGLFYGGTNILVCQICGVLWIIGWVAVTMTPFFTALKFLGMFRVDALEEEVGLDISHHKGSAYDMTGPTKEDVEELAARKSTQHGGGVEKPEDIA